MALEILAIGDLHLGRTPIGLPEGFAPRDFSPRVALSLAVEHAVQRRVDAVVLLGDVVDHDRDFIEAYGALELEIERLVRAKIEVLAVVGNHDVHVLPRLARQIRELQLIGAGSAWQEYVLERPDRGAVRFVGWSFASPRVKSDPLDTLELRARNGIATIGLVHGDLGKATSEHAPLSRAKLVAARFDAWLLGHIHKPTLGGDPDRIGYLGSLVGLDPGEPGVHGPWLVRVEGSKITSCEQLPLAPMRWEAVELALGSEMDADAAEEGLVRALQTLRDVREADWGEAKLVGVRVRVTGRTKRGAEVLGRLRQKRTQVQVGHAPTLFVEEFVDLTRPDRDLVALAATEHPASGLARRLLALGGEGGVSERDRLIREARRALESVRAKACFMELDASVANDLELAELMLQEGHELLEALFPQEATRT